MTEYTANIFAIVSVRATEFRLFLGKELFKVIVTVIISCPLLIPMFLAKKQRKQTYPHTIPFVPCLACLPPGLALIPKCRGKLDFHVCVAHATIDWLKLYSGARLSWEEPGRVPRAPEGWLTQAELTWLTASFQPWAQLGSAGGCQDCRVPDHILRAGQSRNCLEDASLLLWFRKSTSRNTKASSDLGLSPLCYSIG